MAHVINVEFRPKTHPLTHRVSTLATCFAHNRRVEDDVFWLKENAEFLNILESSGQQADADALQSYAAFYENAERRMGFFPQYYRFLLSLTLDLEDLGMPGTTGERLAAWVVSQGLVEAELSDLQRAEAQRLLARRGHSSVPDAEALDTRLRAFCRRSATFALPNKKAAYELTHIVFYLSEYGRRDPQLDPAIVTSLLNAGILAFLDQNADLLAEVCVALQYGRAEIPSQWLDWLNAHTQAFLIEEADGMQRMDAYHEYLVCNWLTALRGGAPFAGVTDTATLNFHRPQAARSALRELSEQLYHMDGARSGSWDWMRRRLAPKLSADAWGLIEAAEEATEQFETFFAGFAREGLVEALA